MREALVFAWCLGVGFTWGRIVIYMLQRKRRPFSFEGGFYAAACFFIWPILLGYVSGDREG